MTRTLALLFVLATTMPAAAESPRAILEKDLEVFLGWFEGRFDNAEQVYFEREMNVPEELRHERIHSIFAPVDLPEVGAHVMYVEQYSDGDPDAIYRQRLYDFTLDETADAIVLTILTLPDPPAVAGAHEDPTLLAGLTRADLGTTPGCDVFWRRRANQFVGEIPDGACRVTSERLGTELVIDDDLLLTQDEIWIADRAETVAGDYVYGHPEGVPHKLRRVRPVSCWLAGRTGSGEDGWSFHRDVTLHDQGGRAWVATGPVDLGDRTIEEIGLRMRRVVWPYGPNRPSLVLYVHERSDPERALSYAWADPDAARIGLNTRWMQASCTVGDG